jgi:HIRAN domain
VADEKERESSLPAHRARRISLTKTQLRTELGAELLCLCESVTADGKVTPEEAQALRQWLDDSVGLDLPAATYLREVVERVIADGEITREECREVYRAVEAVLPPEVRRQAVATRREVESAERGRSKADKGRALELKRQERRRNAPIGSANFMVAGCRYEGRPELIEQYANPDDPVRLRRDAGNRYSRNAVAVDLESGHQIGFVPEEYATELAPMIDEGARPVAYITKILTGGRSPIPVVQARLYGPDSTVEDPVGSGQIARSERRVVSRSVDWSKWLVVLLFVAGLIALIVATQ